MVAGCSSGGVLKWVTLPANDMKRTAKCRLTLTVAGSTAVRSKSIVVSVLAKPAPPANCSDLVAGADLHGCNLSGIDLSHDSLVGANLTGANLSGAVLVSAVGSSTPLVGHAEATSGIGLERMAGASNSYVSTNMAQADLAGANLSGTVSLPLPGISGADFAGAQLAGADLGGGNFYAADFAGADLTGADLTSATLYSADLIGAKLDNAILVDATMNQAVLTDATIDGVDLQGATLFFVTSGGVVGTPATPAAGWRVIDGYVVGKCDRLSGANLASADLSGMDLDGADLSGAILTYANLTGTSITYYEDQQQADLSNADLQGANLTGAYLENANLTGSDLASATLTGVFAELSGGTPGGAPGELPAGWTWRQNCLFGPGADLSRAFNLQNADLSNLDLAGADLSGDVSFGGANFSGTDLEGANLTDTDVEGDNFTDADLLGAAFTPPSLDLTTWSNTICPDGTNSDNDGGTCASEEAIPGPADIVALVPGDGQVSVAWSPPANAASSDVTFYSVAATDVTSPGSNGDGNLCGSDGVSTTCTVTGLTDGDSYTFVVTAWNVNGVAGQASTPSPSVIPSA